MTGWKKEEDDANAGYERKRVAGRPDEDMDGSPQRQLHFHFSP